MFAVTGCKRSLAGTSIVDQRGTKKFEDTQINLQVKGQLHTPRIAVPMNLRFYDQLEEAPAAAA